MAMEVLPGNGLQSTLNGAITNSQTTITIQTADAALWPASGFYRVVLCTDPTNGPFEIVRVTGGQGTATLTVVRAAEPYNGASTAYAFASGAFATPILTNGGLSLIALQPGVNLLTNGGMELWQRGTSAFTANGYCADRWNISLAGTDTISVIKDTTNIDVGSNAAAAVTFTLGTGAGASNLQQQLKTVDGYQVKSRAYSFTARIRTSTNNAVRIALQGDVTAAVYSVYQTGSGAYQTLACTITLGTTDTLVQASIYFAASCTAYIDQCMVAAGLQPVLYVPIPPADDLARAQRYYEISGGTQYELIMSGYGDASARTYYFSFPYATTKCVSPTVTKVGASWTVSGCGQPAVDAQGISMFRMNITTNITNIAAYANANTPGATYVTSEANP